MNFAFVITNLKVGGAEKAIIKSIDLLLNANHSCTLILLESNIKYELDPRIKVESIHQGESAGKGWLSKRLLAFKLKKVLSRLNADATISTLPFADEVTALTGTPRHWCRIANTLSAEVRKLADSSQRKSKRRLNRFKKIYGSRPLIAVSKGVADDLRDKLGLKSQIEIIYNPFSRLALLAQAKEEIHWPSHRPFVIYVGRFAPQKRPDVLLDAFLQVDDRYDLVMLTPATPALLEMISSRGLSQRVHVVGFQKNPYAWMARASLLALTSDHEGLPNVLIEALMCGTPVVSTDCPSGPREILEEIAPESLVPCGNVREVAAAIERQLQNAHKAMNVDLSRFDEKHALAAYQRLVELRI